MCPEQRQEKYFSIQEHIIRFFIFQDGELKEYRADRMPIGIYYGEKESFTNYEINVKKGDTIYIFSDGFADQFGGPDGVKI